MPVELVNVFENVTFRFVIYENVDGFLVNEHLNSSLQIKLGVLIIKNQNNSTTGGTKIYFQLTKLSLIIVLCYRMDDQV